MKMVRSLVQNWYFFQVQCFYRRFDSAQNAQINALMNLLTSAWSEDLYKREDTCDTNGVIYYVCMWLYWFHAAMLSVVTMVTFQTHLYILVPLRSMFHSLNKLDNRFLPDGMGHHSSR